MSTLDDDLHAFESRLHNWGALYRPERGRPATSPTYDVCLQLARENGGLVHDGYRAVSAKREIDEDDARIIEYCWGRSRYRMDAKHWALLRAHYVMRHDQRMLCRSMQIRWRSYDSVLADAVRRFAQCVAMMDTVDKPAKPV